MLDEFSFLLPGIFGMPGILGMPGIFGNLGGPGIPESSESRNPRKDRKHVRAHQTRLSSRSFLCASTMNLTEIARMLMELVQKRDLDPTIVVSVERNGFASTWSAPLSSFPTRLDYAQVAAFLAAAASLVASDPGTAFAVAEYICQSTVAERQRAAMRACTNADEGHISPFKKLFPELQNMIPAALGEWRQVPETEKAIAPNLWFRIHQEREEKEWGY